MYTVLGTHQLSRQVLLVVNEREEDVVALCLPIGLLKTCSGLEPVLRCEPNTYQSIGHYAIQAGTELD